MPRICFLVLLASAALALSGCGHSASDSGAGSHGPLKTAGSVIVHLSFFPNVTHAAALVGSGRGTFAKALAPATVEERSFTAGPAEIEALFANEVDIGYLGPGPALNGFLKSRGKALRIIAGASSGGAALVVRQDSGIVDIKGLTNKKVAVPQTGGTQDISLRHALQQAGLASTERGGTVVVQESAPADTLTMFKQNQLDAAWVPEPWVSRLVKEGGGKILIDERDLWPHKRFATTVVVVRQQFLQEHPDLVQKFLNAHVETVDWIARNPKGVPQVVGDRIAKINGKKLPLDIVRAALSRTDITYDPLGTSVASFADGSKQLGYRRDNDSIDALIDTKPLNRTLKARGLPAVP